MHLTASIPLLKRLSQRSVNELHCSWLRRMDCSVYSETGKKMVRESFSYILMELLDDFIVALNYSIKDTTIFSSSIPDG